MSQILQMPPPAPHKPARSPRILAVVAVLIFCGSGLGYWLYAGRVESLQGRFAGQLVPVDAPLSSTVAEVLTRAGDHVTTGQRILRLEGSSYLKQEAEARALVKGSHGPTAEDTEERVAAAQAAEEYTVRRVALARHEEDARRQEVEQRSSAHARAQLRLRDLDVSGVRPSGQREKAQQAENEARLRLDSAKGAFEAASRSRAAVEGELRRARQDVERAKARQGRPATASARANVASAPTDPTLVLAPGEGRIVGALPQVGQKIYKGETLFQLAPDNNASLWAIAKISEKEAARVRTGQPCYLQPENMPGTILQGEVEDLLPPETSRAPGHPVLIPVRIRLTDPAARRHSASLTGQQARLVLWTNSVPGMNYLSPLLSYFSTY